MPQSSFPNTLEQALKRIEELEATLVAFCSGELPKSYTLQQKLFQQYGERLAYLEDLYKKGILNGSFD